MGDKVPNTVFYDEKCVICLDEKIGVGNMKNILVPCGHQSVCDSCWNESEIEIGAKCPSCREVISDIKQIAQTDYKELKEELLKSEAKIIDINEIENEQRELFMKYWA